MNEAFVPKWMGRLANANERIAELEAEVAERDGRRCDGCSYYSVGHTTTFCSYGVVLANGPGTVRPNRDFACNRWAERDKA